MTDRLPPTLDDAGDGVSEAWRAKVAGKLINPATMLATDYLNHFNEVIMMIDMIADMPEMLDDVLAWKPKTYAEHFRASGLDYGDLAAEAYDHVPRATRQPFEATVAQIRQVIDLAKKRIQANLAVGDPEEVRRSARASATVLTALGAAANGIISGGRETMKQSEIDRLLTIA